MINSLSRTLISLELKFDGGIFGAALTPKFNPNKIERLIVHDHISCPTDDPELRPSILALTENIIEPNGFKIRELTLYYYRRHTQRVVTFLRKIDRETLLSLEISAESNFEESNDKYQEDSEELYQAIGSFYNLKTLTINDCSSDNSKTRNFLRHVAPNLGRLQKLSLSKCFGRFPPTHIAYSNALPAAVKTLSYLLLTCFK